MENCNDFGFRNQLCRATISIMNNIAEGFERQTNKEFAQFLYISKGSCGKVRSMLYIGLERKYILKRILTTYTNHPLKYQKYFQDSLNH